MSESTKGMPSRTTEQVQNPEQVKVERDLPVEGGTDDDALEFLNVAIESQIKVAMARVATAFESELRKLEDRINRKFGTESEILSRDLEKASQRVSVVEHQLRMSREKQILDALAIMDKKLENLEEAALAEDKTPVRMQVENVWREKVLGWKEEFYHTLEASARGLRSELSDLDLRFKTFHNWFKDCITPELALIHSKLEVEASEREKNDESLLSCLSKYTRVMYKHFGVAPGVEGLEIDTTHRHEEDLEDLHRHEEDEHAEKTISGNLKPVQKTSTASVVVVGEDEGRVGASSRSNVENSSSSTSRRSSKKSVRISVPSTDGGEPATEDVKRTGSAGGFSLPPELRNESYEDDVKNNITMGSTLTTVSGGGRRTSSSASRLAFAEQVENSSGNRKELDEEARNMDSSKKEDQQDEPSAGSSSSKNRVVPSKMSSDMSVSSNIKTKRNYSSSSTTSASMTSASGGYRSNSVTSAGSAGSRRTVSEMLGKVVKPSSMSAPAKILEQNDEDANVAEEKSDDAGKTVNDGSTGVEEQGEVPSTSGSGGMITDVVGDGKNPNSTGDVTGSRSRNSGKPEGGGQRFSFFNETNFTSYESILQKTSRRN
ncbi:unnamed protein product [Amoebophrya sp. A25]|nr:unnamed protein product [Amoebophrya sp. A25]|eukprot:GSA25T00027407001.1